MGLLNDGVIAHKKMQLNRNGLYISRVEQKDMGTSQHVRITTAEEAE